MIRKAFVMSVHHGAEAEYERRHNPIWPELERVLRTHGVNSYSIFVHPETRQLFAYVEVEDEAQWRSIADTSVCRRWWKSMAELMPHHGDGSPCSIDLKEVFHVAKDSQPMASD
jgi:L-rhamnose mutarotase